MSNPGLILLAQTQCLDGFVKRFQIEDNIGEAIHIHIDNLRIDLTVAELLEFAELIGTSIDNLRLLGKYSVRHFDPMFLLNCAPYLPHLSQISIEKITLKDLEFIVHKQEGGAFFHEICSVTKTPAYRFLAHQDLAFLDYAQDRYCQQDNVTRINQLKKSIEHNGYPCNEQYVILFNNQNYVRDGQHRAAVLALLYGVDKEIEVMRFHFKENIGDFYPVQLLEQLNELGAVQQGKRAWLMRQVRRIKRILSYLSGRLTKKDFSSV